MISNSHPIPSSGEQRAVNADDDNDNDVRLVRPVTILITKSFIRKK